MADKKISELTALTSADFATDDLFAVVDTSATETKKTTIADLDARYASSGVTQYTNEMAQDAVGTILVDSSTIDLTYNDGTPSITAAVVAGSIGNTELGTGLDASKIGSGGVSSAEFDFLAGVTSDIQTQFSGKANTVHTHVASDVTDFSEAVDDRVSALIVAGANVSATYNDPANTLTIAVSGVSLTGHTHTSADITDFNEAAQDAIGAMLANTATINLTYTDGTPELSAAIVSGSIANAQVSASAAIDFSKLAALTSGNILVGNASNVAASVAMSGDVTINNAGSTTIGAQKVGVSKMTLAANTFAANNTGSTAAPTEITYKSVAAATYSGSISFTASVAPSGATTNQYTWQQVGDLVTLVISLKYASAGTSVQAVAMELPGDVPSPVELSGNTAASDRIANGSGWIETTSSAAAGAARCYIRRNAGDTAYEMFIQAGASNAAYAQGTVVYRTV